MCWFLIVLGVLFGIMLFLFLDYLLFLKQMVWIINIYNCLIDIGVNVIFYVLFDMGMVQNVVGQCDVCFIDMVCFNGKFYVYCNEDIGWIWLFYFKYDSLNLYVVVIDWCLMVVVLEWVSIILYGWWVLWMLIYFNVILVKLVVGFDVWFFNWFVVIILLVMGVLLMLIWCMWNQFCECSIDLMLVWLDVCGDVVCGWVSCWWKGC